MSLLWSYVDVIFFMLKTAYEMPISDWSSDVFSSDLLLAGQGSRGKTGAASRLLCEWHPSAGGSKSRAYPLLRGPAGGLQIHLLRCSARHAAQMLSRRREGRQRRRDRPQEGRLRHAGALRRRQTRVGLSVGRVRALPRYRKIGRTQSRGSAWHEGVVWWGCVYRKK